jgi:hypothetical protein
MDDTVSDEDLDRFEEALRGPFGKKLTAIGTEMNAAEFDAATTGSAIVSELRRLRERDNARRGS